MYVCVGREGTHIHICRFQKVGGTPIMTPTPLVRGGIVSGGVSDGSCLYPLRKDSSWSPLNACAGMALTEDVAGVVSTSL